jgi:hypothetical protein
MSKPQTATANESISTMSDLAKQSLSALSGAMTAWLHDAGKVQAEAIRFLNERMQKDMDLLGQFSECQTPQDIASVQARLLTSLVTDYAQESQAMFSLLGTLSKHNLDHLHKVASVAPRH